MSPLTATAPQALDSQQLERLCTSIRGKLQFMDYLVSAAVADAERYRNEGDAGNRVFVRQLIEMYATNLASEADDLRILGELRKALDALLDADQGPASEGEAR